MSSFISERVKLILTGSIDFFAFVTCERPNLCNCDRVNWFFVICRPFRNKGAINFFVEDGNFRFEVDIVIISLDWRPLVKFGRFLSSRDRKKITFGKNRIAPLFVKGSNFGSIAPLFLICGRRTRIAPLFLKGPIFCILFLKTQPVFSPILVVKGPILGTFCILEEPIFGFGHVKIGEL